MPTTFHDREQAFEAKFAHDEEFRFLVAARRDKLFARWAAGKLGLSGEKSEALVKIVMAIPDGPGHDEALFQHILGLFSVHDVSAERKDLSIALEQNAKQARQQLIDMPTRHSDAS